jgi:AcrR family transcriptional regulator
MRSLRERQKAERREAMLDAARGLFVERGYGKTTMEAIAERAGVGVATVYTYFASKEGVFAELARLDMGTLRADGEALLQDPPTDPVAAVLALIDVYVKVHEFISYEVIREFSIGSRQEGPIRQVAGWVSDWQCDQLQRALRAGQRSGRVAPGLPLKDAARIVADLLERYYERAVSAERDRRAHATLRRQVRLLFRDWRGAGEVG